jgi:hypothetical protein
VEFLPKFAATIEDLIKDLDENYLMSNTPEIQQLLRMKYP